MSLDADIRRTRLCIVGNLNRDLRTAPLRPSAGLFRDGETPIDAIVDTFGGGAANSAVGAADLGAEATLVARVGDDDLGRRLAAALAARGVRPRLALSPDAPTGTSLALGYASGERHFLSCLPSSRQLRDEDVTDEALVGRDHLLRADPWFSEAMLFGGNRRLFTRARAAGAAVSLDLNWDPSWGRAPTRERRRRVRALRDVLPLVDLAHGNARELCAFTDQPRLAPALRALERWGVAAVVVHLGGRGSGWWQAGALVTEPACPVARIVNHTGTGDRLSVAMMALHRSAATPTEKLRFANRAVAAYMEGASRQPALVERAGA